MNKKIILAAIAVTVLGAGALTARSVSAQSASTDQDPMSSLVEKIANKFGLQESDVQAVFDEQRREHEAQHKAAFETQLSQYVTEGKITEAQKQAIIARHAEMLSNRQSMMEKFESMTDEERKAAMDSERQALEAWAKENGIDMQYLLQRPSGFGKHHGKFGGPGPHFERPIDTTQPVVNTTI